MFRIDRTLVNMESIEANIDIFKEFNAPDSDAGEPTSARKEDDQEVINIGEEQLSSYAENIISHANMKAEAILQLAESDALEIKKIARQKGFDEGMIDAEEKINKAYEDDKALVRSVISTFEQARIDMLDSIESEILRLTFAIIKKVFNQVNKSDSSMFEAMIINALKQMKKEGKITIRVSKEEYDRFFSSGDASFILGDKFITAIVLPDAHMNCGDCLIESDGETVNAGLDTQIMNMEIAFKQVCGDAV